ncbi:hypothetical protein PHYBOEH_002617 [Phytophthora boehmeriae]|uniref:PX domain-containing protein n=1 Tax=Phytophthora boehmeriae TaxID=109152 RepID=A0A8T1V5S0_9STRA|nr:hypothetical protein PHYBOEH_002617 [Phytophthora boehmeriae]
MGCSHSKVNNVVVEPVTAPPSECGKGSMDLAFTEIILDHDAETSSVPPQVVEEAEGEEKEVEDVKVEDEQEAASLKPSDPEELSLQTLERESGVQRPSAGKGEEPAVEAEITNEPTAVEKETPVPVEDDVKIEAEEEPVEPEVEAEDEVEVAKSAVMDKSAVTDKSIASAPVLAFTADKVIFTVGVAFFNIIASTGEEEIHLAKRYSEFKVLHAEMAKIMTKEELPAMPGTSFLQGRNDRALLDERETAFVKMLNAIAQHPQASQSDPFVAFLE